MKAEISTTLTDIHIFNRTGFWFSQDLKIETQNIVVQFNSPSSSEKWDPICKKKLVSIEVLQASGNVKKFLL